MVQSTCPNLILHCGAHRVERDALSSGSMPQRTRTHVPIDHGHYLSRVEIALHDHGLRPIQQAHALSHEGQRYFGLIQVTSDDPEQDYAPIVGIRNSHDKSFPAGLVMGACVLVCDNLSFSGEVQVSRKHTTHIHRDLPLLIHESVQRLSGIREHQTKRIEYYKNKTISDLRAHDLLVKAVDQRVMPASRLPLALQEWREPRHSSFTEHGRSAWRLFNAVTEAIKGRTLNHLPRRTQVLHRLVDSMCGLANVA